MEAVIWISGEFVCKTEQKVFSKVGEITACVGPQTAKNFQASITQIRQIEKNK